MPTPLTRVFVIVAGALAGASCSLLAPSDAELRGSGASGTGQHPTVGEAASSDASPEAADTAAPKDAASELPVAPQDGSNQCLAEQQFCNYDHDCCKGRCLTVCVSLPCADGSTGCVPFDF